MDFIDIRALRKQHNMTQKELARRLNLQQSFLSALENGRSRLPVERYEQLCEIFSTDIVRQFTSAQPLPQHDVNPEHKEESESELMAKMLRIFHDHEHKEDHHNHALHHQKMDEMQERMSRLLDRNDRLAERAIKLQDRLDRLTAKHIEAQNEIARLRELLIRHKIDF